MGVLMYSNTLLHQYVLDDAELIAGNRQVQQGVSAIGEIFSSKMRDGGGKAIKNELYRPVTKLLYALEWDISENNPAIGHFFNIVLFALLCVLVFFVARLLFRENFIAAAISAVMFAVHPIHTEVVANIKSVDEILALLFFLGSLLLLHRYLSEKKNKFLLAALGAYALSLFSKESAVLFIALVPLFIYFTQPAKTPVIKHSLWFVAPLLVFLMVRHRVMDHYDHANMIGKIDNFLVAAHSPSERIASALYMLGHDLKLLLFPYPLVCDYSYSRFPLVSFMHPQVLVIAMLIAALLIYIVKQLNKKNMLAFSLAWIAVTMVVASNLFYLIGTNFAERLLFAPSLGVCLLLGVVLSPVPGTGQAAKEGTAVFFSRYRPGILLAVVIVAVFGYITISRNKEWKNNKTLIAADVLKHPGSARLHVFMANELRNEIVESNNAPPVQQRNLPQIRQQLKQAVSIHPAYGSAHFALGEYYMHVDSFPAASSALKQALFYLPMSPKVYNALGMCMLSLHHYDSAIYYVRSGLNYDPRNPELIAKYGAALLNKNKPDSAIYFLEQSVAIWPKNSWAYEQLAKAYTAKQDSAKSRQYKKLAQGAGQ